MACALLLGMAQAAWAQEDTLATAPVDTTAAAQVDTSATASVLVQESLLPYRMQKRYRPVNQPFHKGGFFANSYLALSSGAYRQMAGNYSNGPYAGVAWGKWFNPYNGMELSGAVATFLDNYDATRMSILLLRASYLFNLSAYVEGYKPSRLVEFYTRVGLGYSRQTIPGEETVSGISGHLGIDVNMRIFPGIDLALQPMLEVQKDGRALARMDIWRRYLLSGQLGMSLRFTLDRERVGGDPGGNWFFTVTGGTQFQNSDLGRQIQFGKAIGAASSIGVGRYYGRAFALRFSAGASWHYWKEIKEGDTDVYGHELTPARFRSAYAFGRLDGMLDLFRLFSSTYNGRVNASVFLGPEAGVIYKEDPYKANILYPYVGFSTGMQLKWNIVGGFCVFLEPRVSIVPYSAYAFQTSTLNRNYYDAVVSLSLGFEYRLNNNNY